MSKELKILYVTRAPVAPPHAGCMIRTMNIYRQLCKAGTVTMLAVSQRFEADSISLCRKECQAFHEIHVKPYTDYPPVIREIARKFHMHWPGSHGVQADADSQRLFDELVQKHDVVWFHTLGSSNPFKNINYSKSIMDLDDLNHCKYNQRSKTEANVRFSLSAKVQAYKWKKEEHFAINHFKHIVVCSDYDKQLMGNRDHIHVVPNGFMRPEKPPVWQMPNSNYLGFIGSLGYTANRNGLVWFRDTVWPLIKKQNPDMQLRIIGTLPPGKKLVKADGFEYLGYIEDPTEEIKTWSAMVVPLLFAGGTRIKILDAFSKMCPVVSTSIGAYGIDVEDEHNILLADTSEVFSELCLKLSKHPEKGKVLAQAGWKLFEESYTWDIIESEIVQIIQEVK